jgi:hypothetical protein
MKYLPRLVLVLVVGLLSSTFPAMLSAQSVSFAGGTPSVNFGNANLCATGDTTPAPCSKALTLNYNVTGSGTLGPIKVVTGGASNLDFTLASGSTCTGAVTQGSVCTVNVQFAPKYPGWRAGAVHITNESGTVLATTFINGFGVGPQVGFNPGNEVPLSFQGVDFCQGYAVDAAGDLFANCFKLGVYTNTPVPLELPADGGPQIMLPLTIGGLSAVDGAGDLYLLGDLFVSELPAGSDTLITIPYQSSSPDSVTSLIVDGAGNLFLADPSGNRVIKLPPGGSQITLPFDGIYYPENVAVDYAGDVFATAQSSLTDYVGALFELPAGVAPRKTLLSSFEYGITAPGSLAADASGNLLLASYAGSPNASIVALPAGSSTPVPVSNASGMQITPAPNGDIFLYDLSARTTAKLQRSRPPSLNFSDVTVGGTKTLTIVNTGNGTLTVTASFNNPHYKIVSMKPDHCLAGITGAQNCALGIELFPETGGSQNGILTLTTNAAATPTLSVTLTAIPTPIPAPVLSLPSGVYALPQYVSITDATSGAAIYYTTNGDTPTASSAHYTGPISVSSTERITAIAIAGNRSSTIATAAYTISSASPEEVLNFSQGFRQALLLLNGSTYLAGSRLQLAGGGIFQTGSAFFANPLNVQSFTTEFTFQLSTPALADGITFTIQNSSASALGTVGGGLGYDSIGKSVAIKFDLHDNAGEGPDSTGLYVNGAMPTLPSIDLRASGIDLHSQDPFLAQITYDGANLLLTLTDTVTLATWSHSFAIDIPATVGGDTAYLGFTGATGADYANQEILSWTYAPGTPASLPPPSATTFNYPAGFNGVGLTRNGSALITPTGEGIALQLTETTDQAASVFYDAPVNIQSFTTDFTFQLTNPVADGFTFTIQNAGLYALGAIGSGLGYAGIGKSVAVKFDLYNNAGEGPDSTGLYLNGAIPTVPAVDLSGTGIDLHSGDAFTAHISYDGTNLNLTLTDTSTLATYSHSFAIDIPATVGGNTAYVGFTGATGEQFALQEILNWTFARP